MLMFLIYILSVLTSFQSLPAEIKAKLESEFSSYKRVEFEIVKEPKNYKNIVFNKNENINIIGNVAYIPIDVIDNNGNKKRTTLSVRAKIYEDVFIAMKDVKRRKQLRPTDFQLLEKEVSSVRGKIVSSLGEIITSRADRSIRKGEILTQESIEKMPIIFPGNKLAAYSVMGNVQISFIAYAKQEGSIGDIIRIRNNENKIFKAEIINNKDVLIIE